MKKILVFLMISGFFVTAQAQQVQDLGPEQRIANADKEIAALSAQISAYDATIQDALKRRDSANQRIGIQLFIKNEAKKELNAVKAEKPGDE